MNRFTTVCSRCLLAVVASFWASEVFGQNGPALAPPPPAPAADSDTLPAPVPENFSTPTPTYQQPHAYQPVPNQQPCPPNGMQYCEPSYCDPECCQQSRCRLWARCKAKEQAKWWGYPEEFEEIPFGSLTNGLIQQPVARGHQARMALYQYDFTKGSEALNSAGRRRVARLAPALQTGWGPLIIEESNDPELDQKRRAAVLQELSLHFPGPSPEFVIVGSPIGAGLNGVEGRAIYRSLMNQTGSRGSNGVGNRGGFTPASGFNSSGSGSGTGSMNGNSGFGR